MTLHKYNLSDFTLVQNCFFDEYMISANGEFVKIYLYLLRCSSAERELSLSSIADAFNYTESDVKRALTYWEKVGLLRLSYSEDGSLTDIILSDHAAASDEPKTRLDSYALRMSDIQKNTLQPPKIFLSADRKKELAQQEDIRQLIYIAEQYLAKKLSSTEVTNLLYFYDELHFSVDLIEYLIEYCVSKGKRSISYIRAVALEWSARGISTVAEAKKDTRLYNKDYYAVLNSFGIKDRGPAQAEAEMMNGWFSELGFPLEIILEACRRTINHTHTPNFQYADKILKSWHEKGVKHLKDIGELDRPPAQEPKTAVRRDVSRNRFHNFQQRKYDFDQLEKNLIDS